jgi:hypothetical protein
MNLSEREETLKKVFKKEEEIRKLLSLFFKKCENESKKLEIDRKGYLMSLASNKLDFNLNYNLENDYKSRRVLYIKHDKILVYKSRFRLREIDVYENDPFVVNFRYKPTLLHFREGNWIDLFVDDYNFYLEWKTEILSDKFGFNFSK